MVRWGVLGLGRAANSFANAIKEVENAKLTSIASLSKNKNSKFGENHELMLKIYSRSLLLVGNA